MTRGYAAIGLHHPKDPLTVGEALPPLLKDLHGIKFEVAPYAVLFKPSHGIRILRNQPAGGFSPMPQSSVNSLRHGRISCLPFGLSRSTCVPCRS